MRYPLGFSMTQMKHRAKMQKMGQKRFPTVLMLEPLFTCNLACVGCSVERHTGKLSDRLPLETCLKAVDDCGAPIINLCGGEPSLYPELPQLVKELYDRKKYILCCTNALAMDKKIFGVIEPNSHFFLMIHLDGMRETHDFVCNRKGVFDNAILQIKEAKKRGYTVMINTTVYKETRVEEVEELCKLSAELKTDGLLLSPGYEFETADHDVFLTKEQTHEKFKAIREFAHKYKINTTPTFMEFAAGMLELPCAPWSTVNYSPQGWKAPCYLVGEKFYSTWDEFWNNTNWEYWESRVDPQCLNCQMHSGFEHSAVEEAMKSWKGKLQMAAWAFTK